MLFYSAAALVFGFGLDLLFGDPRPFHIIPMMGRLIAGLEKALRRWFPKTPAGERVAGIFLVVPVLMLCTGVPFVVLWGFYTLSPFAGMAVESLLCWQLLAVKSLGQESDRVRRSLQKENLPAARQDVARIVGRDTQALDVAGVTRAAVETVAENTADGVIAPLFYLLLGGGALGCCYKAINTMDSMVGYKNDRYLHFGRAAAQLDDVANYLPARLAALLMICCCAPLGLSAAGGWGIWRRDRRNHASPNSAQTEAVMAGALGVQLAGNATYFGKLVEKPTIGDPLRAITHDDILQANRLLYATATLMLLLSVMLRILLGVLL